MFDNVGVAFGIQPLTLQEKRGRDMGNMKSIALLMIGLVAISGLSACARTGAGPESKSETQQGQQTFGKSYVKEIPESEVKRQETEMTSPKAEDKGPALGSQTPEPKKQDEQKQSGNQ